MTIEPGIALRDSVTKTEAEDAGRVLVTGSHGGLYAANLAARARFRAAIFNDAGIGKERAGIAGLAYLEGLGMAAATVGFETARIGDAGDAWARGTISHVNGLAADLGCACGQDCAEAARHLRAARIPESEPPALEETAHLIASEPGAPRVWALDSASLVGPEHVGQIVLVGSHGALLGGRPEAALKADALAAVYNDAGIGIDEAGVSRLPALDARGIAAATVAAASARIGDGLSTYRDGVLSRVNATAAALGAAPGMGAEAFVARVIACHKERADGSTGGGSAGDGSPGEDG
jgi:hypothetical protein